MNAHSHTCPDPRLLRPARRARSGPTVAARAVAAVRDLLERWRWRMHYRTELEHLSEHQLRDMGLDRHEVWREADKPFWQA